MTRRLLRLTAALVTVGLLSGIAPVRAQQAGPLAVYDDSNWYEALLQLIQMVDQFEFFVKQAKRLPFDMASRYHGHSVDWTFHDLESGLLYAQRLLTALNEGDPTGRAYRQAVDPLDVPTDILGRMPRELQDRLTRAYATLELADSVAELAVDQTGAMRTEGPHNLQVAKNMEHDAVSGDDSLNTQTAILNKINTAETLGLRIQAQINQSLASALEQAIVTNKRQRDADALVMNATIYQWRYGQAYGDSLFQNTANNLDTWRLR